MLKDCELLRTGEPHTITTGTPPYRVQYPLHGFADLHETKKPPKGLRPSAKLARVANAKPAPKAPAPTTRQTPPPSSAVENTNGGTVVKLPPKKESGDTSRVDDIVKKIPDLSFMLSSELSLPAHS